MGDEGVEREEREEGWGDGGDLSKPLLQVTPDNLVALRRNIIVRECMEYVGRDRIEKEGTIYSGGLCEGGCRSQKCRYARHTSTVSKVVSKLPSPRTPLGPNFQGLP
jgi:hypothetical protein